MQGQCPGWRCPLYQEEVQDRQPHSDNSSGSCHCSKLQCFLIVLLENEQDLCLPVCLDTEMINYIENNQYRSYAYLMYKVGCLKTFFYFPPPPSPPPSRTHIVTQWNIELSLSDDQNPPKIFYLMHWSK